MLGSIHFKLIREANSFNEVRTFVLTIVSVNDKSLTVYLYGEFVFFAFLLLCSFQRSMSERNILPKPNNARMCSTHAVTSVTHAP